jgi:UDP-glucuronate 4-epimerase
MSETWLVTGALGCIGAWTVATLVREGAGVVAFDIATDDRRLRLIATPEELARVTFARGDITQLETVERALTEHGVTHVVHLAALQVPFCKADPVLGAQVNVTGTVNVFEAAKRRALETTIAYASSAAVYDGRGEIAPRTLYGVYKVANEGTARVYRQEDGVASIGLRPFSVYGPGRDQGLTAGPTLAIESAVRGEPYRIAFGGRTQFHYAPDVARAFVRAGL